MQRVYLPITALLTGVALLLIHGAGAAVGPLFAGYLMNLFGGVALPLYFAAVQGLLALLILRVVLRSRSREPQPAHFTPILRTSPAAMEMTSSEFLDGDAEDSAAPSTDYPERPNA